MNLAQQRKTIAVSAMLVFAFGTLAHAEKGELPTARFLIGVGGIYTIISVFADFGSPIGAGMAIIVLITAVLTEGEGVLNLLSKRGGFAPKPQAQSETKTQRVNSKTTQRVTARKLTQTSSPSAERALSIPTFP